MTPPTCLESLDCRAVRYIIVDFLKVFAHSLLKLPMSKLSLWTLAIHNIITMYERNVV